MVAPELSRWVEAFESGTRHGEPYSDADLDHAVAAFHKFKGRLDPPVVVGHSEDQSWLRDSGLPAAGWVADARKNKGKLEVRFGRMPPLIRKLIDAGAYDKVSVELYPKGKPPEGIDADGIVIRRVSLMGGQLPQVKTLQGLADLWEKPAGVVEFGECLPPTLHYTRQEELPGGTFLVFFECEHCQGNPPMDRKALEKQLTDAGYNAEAVAAFATVPDDKLAGVVDTILKNFVPPGKPAPVAEPVAPALAAQFAEMQATAASLKGELAGMKQRQAAEEAESRRRQQAERGRTVEAFCERWGREGFVLPREIDKGAKTPNLYHRLMVADGSQVRRFGETDATEFDSLVAEIESRGPGFARRHFSEQIPQPGDSKDSVDEEAKAYAARRNKKAG